MRKRLMTALLSLVMVFSMSVPSFASTTDPFEGLKMYSGDYTDVQYVALGDSIANGCTVLWPSNFESKGYRQIKMINRYGSDLATVDIIDYSYPNLFAEDMGYDVTKCINAAHPGLRVKDMCEILGGIKELKGHEYSKDWEEGFGCNISQRDRAALIAKRDKFTAAIKNAKVITVQFGMNEFPSLLYKEIASMERNVPSLISAVKTAISLAKELGNTEDVETLKAMLPQLKTLLSIKTSSEDKAKTYSDVLAEINGLRGNYDKLKETVNQMKQGIDDSIIDAVKDYKYYWKGLMKRIRQLNKKAVVIAVTTPSPCNNIDSTTVMSLVDSKYPDMKDTASQLINGSGTAIKLVQGVVQLATSDMNAYVYALAGVYNYVVANATSIKTANNMDKVEAAAIAATQASGRTYDDADAELDRDQYDGAILDANSNSAEKFAEEYFEYALENGISLFHPNKDGYAKMAKIVKKAYKRYYIETGAKVAVGATIAIKTIHGLSKAQRAK